MSAFHHPKLVAEHIEEKRERLLKRVLGRGADRDGRGPLIIARADQS